MSEGVNYRYLGYILTPIFGTSLTIIRSFAAKQGSSLGLTGFVQNNSDETVSGEAQGDKSKLKVSAK